MIGQLIVCVAADSRSIQTVRNLKEEKTYLVILRVDSRCLVVWSCVKYGKCPHLEKRLKYPGKVFFASKSFLEVDEKV